MKKKNLFQAVKTFINDTPKGETFTTKELIASVGNQEEPSSWKNEIIIHIIEHIPTSHI
jgi:hypothetical protein